MIPVECLAGWRLLYLGDEAPSKPERSLERMAVSPFSAELDDIIVEGFGVCAGV